MGPIAPHVAQKHMSCITMVW